MSDPLSLQSSQTLHVNLVTGVAHVGHNTALLHLVQVDSGYHVLSPCLRKGGGREGGREGRGGGREGGREGGGGREKV